MKTRVLAFTLCAAAALVAQTSLAALDTLFSGPLYTPPDYQGEMLTGGALRLQSGSSSTISATFTHGMASGSFSDNLVLFIDSKPGGFANSSTFVGSGILGQTAAGYNGIGRSTAVFNDGFGADYILAVGVNNGGAIFSIGSDGALSLVQSFAISPNDSPNYRTYTFNFDWNSIGAPSPQGFRFFSSYVADGGSRRLDSMETITGSRGFGRTITFDNFNVFGVDPVPEPTNIALGIFGGLAMAGIVTVRLRDKFRVRRAPAPINAGC